MGTWRHCSQQRRWRTTRRKRHTTGTPLFDGDPANPTNVIVRDAMIGVATTRLDNYNLATVASSLTNFNAGGIPYALTPSAVSALPQLTGVGSTQAEGYGGGWLHIRKASGTFLKTAFMAPYIPNTKGPAATYNPLP